VFAYIIALFFAVFLVLIGLGALIEELWTRLRERRAPRRRARAAGGASDIG
jgi:hypothetical protein